MATNAGTIVVDLNAKIDQFKKNIKSAQGSVGKFKKNVGNFVNDNKLAFAVAGAAVAAFAAKSIKAFGIQEQAIAQLNQSLKNTGNFSAAASQDLQNYAASLQKITTFGDETILKSQALIASFGFEGEVLKKLTKATADLAAAKGFDLVQAADLVSKSVGSTTNALTRYGIEVGGAAGSTERAESAIENITKLFGGQAEVLRNTTLGQLQGFQNAFGDLQETLGGFLAGPGTDFAIWLTEIVAKVDDGIKTINESIGSWREFGVTISMVFIEILASATMSIVRFIETFSGIGPLLKLVGVDMDAFNRKIDENIVRMKESAQANLNNINARIQGERKRAEQETEIKNNEANATKKRLLEAAIAKVEADKLEKKMLEENEKAADKFTEEQQDNAFKREKELKRNKEKVALDHSKTLESIASQSENFMTNLFSNHLSAREKRQAIFRQVMGNLQRLVTQQFIRSQVTQRATAIRTSAVEVGAAKAPIAAKFFSAHAALPFIGQAIALGFIAAAFSFIDRVAKFQTGGIVPGAGSQDTVPALLTPGERVLTKRQNKSFESGMMGSPINITFNVSGQFIDGSESKWQDMIRTRLLPEIKRLTQSRPNSPFNRIRGAP